MRVNVLENRTPNAVLQAMRAGVTLIDDFQENKRYVLERSEVAIRGHPNTANLIYKVGRNPILDPDF